MKIEKDFYNAICNWNKKKTIKNFIQLYKDGFDTNAFFGFRVWRIIRNTFKGKYKDIEQKVNNKEFVVKY